MRATMQILFAVVPPGDRIVVHGHGDAEENALRIAGALSRRAVPDAVVTMLCADPAAAARYAAVALEQTDWDPARVCFVKKRSVRGPWAFVRARLTFSTHGLFGRPEPGRRRLHVMLGHGHGPKSSGADPGVRTDVAQIATTNNRVWGFAVLADSGVDVARSAFATGNPRDDAFDEDAGRARLTTLGIDPARPLVLWLPTWRPDTPAFDAVRRAATDRLARLGSTLDAYAAERGVTLVTKVHQMDAGISALHGDRHVVTSETLADAGLSFFRLLAAADGVLSDYSSVWVDYLVRRRPVGLLFDDAEMFGRERGFNRPTIDEVASDLMLRTPDDVVRFVDEVCDHHARPREWEPARRVSRELGLVTAPQRTDRVLDLVAERAERYGRPLLRAR